MRSLMPTFVFFLAVAALHSTLSASLESAEKEEVAEHDGLTQLQKIDQMEFEAAYMNVTEEQSEDTHYFEAAQDGSVAEHVEVETRSAEGGGSPDLAARQESQSESSEETDFVGQRREQHDTQAETVSSVDEVSQDSTREQDLLE